MRAVMVSALLVVQFVACAQDWGPSANGLRIALAVENESVVITFRNDRADREMFLPLGRAVGIGRADSVHIDLIQREGQRHELQYTGGSGVAPGRLLPYIVPMMPGSIYSMQTPLHYWRAGSELKQIDTDLAHGAALQASIVAPESLQSQYVNCYGLQIFWHGRAVSKVFQPRLQP